MTTATETCLWLGWLAAFGYALLYIPLSEYMESKSEPAFPHVAGSTTSVPDVTTLLEENQVLRAQLRTAEVRARCLEDEVAAPGRTTSTVTSEEYFQELARYHASKAADYALIALVLSKDLGKSS